MRCSSSGNAGRGLSTLQSHDATALIMKTASIPNSSSTQVAAHIPVMQTSPAQSQKQQAPEADACPTMVSPALRPKTGKKGEPLNEAKTVRQLFKVVNGKNMPPVPAIVWLRELLAEQPGNDITKSQKENCINILKEVLARRGRRQADLWEITPDDIGQFKARLVAAKLSNATIRHYLDLLGTMFQTAKRRKLVRRNVVRLVRRPPRSRNSPRRPFTDEELQKTCDAADDEWFGMILVALYTGLRLGDVAGLVYRDVDRVTKFIRASVKKSKLFETKPIPPLLEQYFNDLHWPANLDQPLFPRAYALLMAGKKAHLSHLFVRLLERAGVRTRGIKVRALIREGAEKYVPLSFHCLRHNHTSMLKSGNIPEAIARRIAGHRSITVSDLYTHLGEDVSLAAVAGLPEIQGVSSLY